MTKPRTKWKAAKDPLFRGDARSSPATPVPSADPSLVRHILYLGGAGRDSPYLSFTEDEIVAGRFAGSDGRIYSTTVRKLKARNINHISRHELLQLLRGKGKGRAVWGNAFEVMQARRYVEEHAEHLGDFSKFENYSQSEVVEMIEDVLEPVI